MDSLADWNSIHDAEREGSLIPRGGPRAYGLAFGATKGVASVAELLFA